MNIYDLPGIINKCRNFAATPANIKAGFLVTGSFPYDKDICPGEEFLFSFVTDIPAPATDTAALNQSNGNVNHDESAEPSSFKRTLTETHPSSITSLTSELVCPVPKPASREGTANNIRENRATKILTDRTVTAAFRDKQNPQQVTKLKTYHQGSKGRLLNKSARDSKKKKIMWKIQIGC
jgi:hypothetical protein